MTRALGIPLIFIPPDLLLHRRLLQLCLLFGSAISEFFKNIKAKVGKMEHDHENRKFDVLFDHLKSHKLKHKIVHIVFMTRR
jgi:hypothetical protein